MGGIMQSMHSAAKNLSNSLSSLSVTYTRYNSGLPVFYFKEKIGRQ